MTTSKALIYQSELDFISRCVLEYPNLETGGDFFGSFTRDGQMKIEFVIGPGKNTDRSPHSFYQDIPYLRECGNYLHTKFGLQHIGAWHSHHQLSLDHPSGGDVNTMKNALSGDKLPFFLISICNLTNHGSVSIKPYMFERNNPKDYTNYNWDVLEGTSPFREKILRENINLFINPTTQNSSNIINIEVKDNSQTNNNIEKPEMPVNSYWKTEAGKQLLRETYNSLNTNNTVTGLEMLQKEDSRIAFTFRHNNIFHEVILPHNYPNSPIIASLNLGNNVFKHIELPDKRHFPSDIDLVLRYIDKKIRKSWF